MRNLAKLAAVAAFALSAVPALAVPIAVTSYNMQNGQAGSFTYWDDSYNGSGSTTTSLAALSGGTGDLTDGVIATNNWFITPAPYVGWVGINPLISFNFGGLVTINSVTLYLDDSNGFGGVAPPGSVTIGSTNYMIADPTSGAPFAFTVSGLGLTGISSLDIQLFDGAQPWVFLSEIQFDDEPVSNSIAEPMTLSLLGAGLAGIGMARRRRV